MMYLIASNLVMLTIITAMLFALFPTYHIICAGMAGKYLIIFKEESQASPAQVILSAIRLD